MAITTIVLYNLSQLSELIALIISLIVWKKNKGSFIQWMSLYLLYTFLNESVAYYLHDFLHKPTRYLYLWYAIIEIIFFTYAFQNLFKGLKYVSYIKVVMWIISSAIIISYLFIFFFANDYIEYEYRMEIILGFYLCILSIYYIYQEFANDNLEEFLIKKSGFWIAAGVLLFYSAMSIVYALHPTASKNNIYIGGLPIHLFFANILSVILYACLSVAIILWKPLPK